MEYAWTLMSVLFCIAQLVSVTNEQKRRPYEHSQFNKHLTIFSATAQPPKPIGGYWEETLNYVDQTSKRDRIIVPPTSMYPNGPFKPELKCLNYSQQIERYRVEMEGNTVLNLSSTGVRTLGYLFINSSHIKTLYLNNNNITEISVMAFYGLPKLEFLSLTNNNISTDKLLYLKGHETLKTLLLDDNYNNGSLEQVFDNMPRLRELSLKRDGITSFAVKLKEFAPSLTKLYLSGNKIESTDFLNDVPETLSHLYLDNNKIDTLAGYKLNNLQELFVNENEITNICAKGDHTESNKKRLTLDGMTKLVKLNVSSNEISNVAEDTFWQLKNLVELDLSNNKIAELPYGVFEGLSSLETLRINKNHLISIPNLCWSNRLKSLDLSDNRIVIVTRDAFCNQQGIDNVSNRINGDFTKLQMLEWLNLSGNRIVNFPVDLFRQSNSLKVLMLKDNNIANINDLFTIRSNTLQELHLEGNPLLSITVSLMPNLKIHLMDCKKETELENSTIRTTTSFWDSR